MQAPPQLTFWRRQRNALRLNANRELTIMNKLQSEHDQADAIRVSKQKLDDYKARLHVLDESVLPYVEENKMDAAVAESEELYQKLQDSVTCADVLLKQIEQPSTCSPPTPSSTSSSQPSLLKTTKLPKLQIEPFSGDVLTWREFWDSFDVSVHSKDQLSSVEKFQYLKSFLRGEALHIVQGYSLTADTYETALAALKERYDHPERCIQSHLEAMIYMEPSDTGVSEMQKVFDKYEAHIRCLVALGLAEDTFGRVFAPLMLSKFPRFIRIELNRRNGATPWNLTNVRTYLKDEIAARHMGSYAVGDRPDNSKQHYARKANHKSGGKDHRAPSTASGLVSSTKAKQGQNQRAKPSPRYPCAFCSRKDHFPEDCQQVKSASDRRATLRPDQCLICLSLKHRMSQCPSSGSCKHCGMTKSHHHSLCRRAYGDTEGSAERANGLNVDAKEFVPAGSLLSASKTDRAEVKRGVSVLGTARAVINGIKKSERVRVVFDACSTRSFARIDVLKRIGARRLGTEPVGLAGLESESRHYDEFGCYEFTIDCSDGDQIPLIVNGLKVITCPIDRHPLNVDRYPILAKFELSDPVDKLELDVQLDVLIGLDYYYLFVGSIEVRLDQTMVLLSTKLGYVANGSTIQAKSAGARSSSTTLLAVGRATPDDVLDDSLERLWRLEDVGVTQSKISPEDEVAAKKFRETICFDTESQRYAVRWPWKHDNPDLPENYGLAYGRLRSLLNRLDDRTLKLYDATIKDQLAKHVVEVAPNAPTGELIHYIPHHCVIRPDKVTTKLRVVYDASAKSSKFNLSLNESLYRGPVLLSDLCGLIMRFRQREIGVTSDIEKAFLQVALQPVDRDVTRFLWIKDIDHPPTKDNLVIYRFARVLFGVIASPYMLAGTIQHHLSKIDTKTTHNILRSCYVDNVISGCRNHAEVVEYYREAKAVFRSASMNLREWFSNDRAFIKGIPSADQGSGTVTSVLGMTWNLLDDTLACHSKLSPTKQCRSKRDMLQAIAQLFDPCSYLSPVTVVGKVMLQQLWKMRVNWDEAVPDSIQENWDRFFRELVNCTSIAVPRFIGSSHTGSMQLHCFCDASMSAYAAVIYQRSTGCCGVLSNLLFAKVRVSPLNEQKLTIPKLELTALTMGCKLLGYVKDEIDDPSCQLFAWTDSQCSLCWVNNTGRLPIYVKNRVEQIKGAGSITLGYVPTSENPADLPTRGVTVEQLRYNRLWWHGPAWLTMNRDHWPESPRTSIKATDQDEDSATSMVTAERFEPPIDVSQFSSLCRLMRVFAWVLRFIKVIKHTHRNLPSQLLASEMSESLSTLLRVSQQQFVAERPSEWRHAQRHLGLFVDQSGLLRCSGKLDNACLPYDARHPKYLPRRSCLTTLLIEDIHQGLSHAGVQHVLADLRTRYWVPRGRAVVKKVLSSCIVCRRWKGGPYRTPDPPALPPFRVEGREAFSAVGIDYLGPLVVKSSDRQPVKAWIVLFTCCVSRAVHLEAVRSMTTTDFLLCFRRFIANYGVPELVISDNARQFHLASKVGNDLDLSSVVKDPAVQGFSSKNLITWKFTVEFAPWMGGLYERMVGITKKALRCSLQNQLVDFQELQTICAEIAATVNSRPLTYCHDDIGSNPLTPNDLIKRRSSLLSCTRSEQDPDYQPHSDTKANVIRQWKRINARINHFWDMWRREYLSSLRERIWKPNNRGGVAKRPSIGNVVLISEKDQPRGKWKIGRIVELITSPADREVRSVIVKTGDGRRVHRPLKMVFPLELSGSGEPVSVDPKSSNKEFDGCHTVIPKDRPKRIAAEKARQRWQAADEDEEE